MAALTFIPVTNPAHTALTAEIADQIWHEYFAAILAPEQIDYMVGKFQSAPAIVRQIEQEGYEYYLLRAGGRYVGYMGIRPADGKLFLSKLYLYKDARGHGYASRAFDFLERLCRERGLGAIWLTVNRHNERAIAVYRKKGFGVIRTQVADIGSGFVMDDFVMEKAVDQQEVV